jgi:GDPmannose 4,6-dehydratase
MAFTSLDLSDPVAVRSLLDKWRPDEVYHLAAFHYSSQDTSVGAGLASKGEMLRVNFLAAKTLAFALLEMRSDSHFVFASSSQMFTAVDMSHTVNERSPRHPSSFYGHTKSWTMDLLTFLRSESGLRASSAILFNHESTRRGAQFVTRKITRAAAMAAAGQPQPLELLNVGSRADWSSAHDVVQALSLMASAEVPRDYVVASGQLHSVRDLLQIAFEHVGLDWTQFANFQQDRATPALVGQPQALEDLLGWRRTVRFEDMVTEMVDNDLNLASAKAE